MWAALYVAGNRIQLKSVGRVVRRDGMKTPAGAACVLHEEPGDQKVLSQAGLR